MIIIIVIIVIIMMIIMIMCVIVLYNTSTDSGPCGLEGTTLASRLAASRTPNLPTKIIPTKIR